MRVLTRNRIVLSAVALTASLVLSSCGGGGEADVDTKALNAMSVDELAKAAAGEEVYWLTTMYPTETAQKVADAFTAKYPDITVKVDRATANENWEKLRTSKAANAAKADVYSSTQLFFYDMAKEAQFVECYRPKTAESLRAEYRDEKGCWFSARQSIFTLAYNTDAVDPDDVPTSYRELTDPKWKGKIGMLDPALSNNGFSAYYTMSEVLGDGDFTEALGYWEAVGANKPVLYKQGGALINAVSSGEVSVGWVFGYRAWELTDQGAPVKVAKPKEGVVSNVDFTALVSDNDAPHASRLFMSFLASKESMHIGTKNAYYYGVRPDVPVYPKGRPAMDDLKIVPPDWDAQEKNHDAFLEMWKNAVEG